MPWHPRSNTNPPPDARRALPPHAGPLAIGISLVSAGLAAANLLLDFDFVQEAARSRQVPRALEWYFSQSMLFTLVWFYTSVLRLLLLLSGGRDD